MAALRRVLLASLSLALLPTLGYASQQVRSDGSIVYEPLVSDRVSRFYTNGRPAAVVLNDSLDAVMSLDAVNVASDTYIRVWCYVRNKSTKTLELMPQDQLSLESYGEGDRLVHLLPPDAPSLVLLRIDVQKEAAQANAFLGGLVSSIGAAVSAAARPHTTTTEITGDIHATMITREDNRDLEAKQNAIQARTEALQASLENLYENLKTSVSSECLRRNTLPPGLSANGYIYFPFGSPTIQYLRGARKVTVRPSPSDLRYRVRMSIPGLAPCVVQFTPVAGE